MNWLIRLLGRKQSLQPGDTIVTKHGPGVIVGGNVIVRLETAPDPLLPTQHQWTYNISEKI